MEEMEGAGATTRALGRRTRSLGGSCSSCLLPFTLLLIVGELAASLTRHTDAEVTIKPSRSRRCPCMRLMNNFDFHQSSRRRCAAVSNLTRL